MRASSVSGSPAAASTNRIVAPSRKGATKAANTMPSGIPRWARGIPAGLGPGQAREVPWRPRSIPGMNVVFVEPFFPANQRNFPRALAEAGATVIGVGEYPLDAMDDQLKGWLHHYERVPSVTDVEAMTRAVRWVQDKLWVDRLEATVEAHILATAQV